jgi:hypothetical protein
MTYWPISKLSDDACWCCAALPVLHLFEQALKTTMLVSGGAALADTIIKVCWSVWDGYV